MIQLSYEERSHIVKERLDLLKKRLEPAVLKRVESVPKAYQYAYAKGLQENATPKEIYKAKCLDCVAFENTKEEIGGCTVRTCPIWHNRPYRTLHTQ